MRTWRASAALRGIVASLSVGLLSAGVLLPAASGQALGDVARKEQERRKSVAPGKVYTNDNLRPTPPPVTPAAPPAAAAEAAPPSASQGQAQAPAADTIKADTVKKDEAYWKGRLQTERTALDRAKVLLDALQSRVNGLQTDFVNRDDPASRAVITAERNRAMMEIDRVTLEVADRTKAIASIQEEARKAGVPAGWYR